MKNILIISLGLLLLFSCKDKVVKSGEETTETATSNADTAIKVITPSDTISYNIKGFNKQIDSCVNDSVNCASFVASFPLVDARIHGKTSDSVNNFVRVNLYKPLIGEAQPNGLNDLLTPYFQAYGEALQTSQNEGEDSIAAWRFERLFRVVHNNYWLFTIEHYERSYAGGAHANSFTHYHHFNPVNGKRIFLDNIFKEGYKSNLTSVAEEKFRKQLGISKGANLDDEGFWFADKVFGLTENFWLDDVGIHFLYNPYEVAAYSIGPIKIEIGYDEVEDIINDKFNPALRQIEASNN